MILPYDPFGQNRMVYTVSNQDIASIQELVNKIKHKKEVGINYMKSWEYEQMIHDRAQEAGYKDGYDNGFNSGFDNGFNDGADKMGQLILLLTEADRKDDITKAIENKDFRKKLFDEFELT